MENINLNLYVKENNSYVSIPNDIFAKGNNIVSDYIKIYTEEGEEIRIKVIVGIYNNKMAKNGLYSGLIGLNLLNEDLRIGDKYEYRKL